MADQHSMGRSSEPPKKSPGWLKAMAAVSTACAVLLCLVNVAALLLVAPRLRDSLEDFDTTIPWLTLQLVGVPGLVMAIVCVLVAIALIVMGVVGKNKKSEIVVGTIIGTIMTILAAVTAVGLFLPMVTLIKSVS